MFQIRGKGRHIKRAVDGKIQQSLLVRESSLCTTKGKATPNVSRADNEDIEVSSPEVAVEFRISTPVKESQSIPSHTGNNVQLTTQSQRLG